MPYPRISPNRCPRCSDSLRRCTPGLALRPDGLSGRAGSRSCAQRTSGPNAPITPAKPLAGRNGPMPSGRLSRTAHDHRLDLGSGAITHPYHPLRGQRFPVLKIHRIGGVDTVILRGTSGGTFAVPLAWTDRAEPSPWQTIGKSPPLFSAQSLASLVELLDLLSARDVNGGRT
jgi:hypothetical protein